MNLNYAGLEISELTVLNQFVVHLPSNILTDIDGHLKDLQNSPTAGRIDIVKKLIECLRTRTPDTLDEFIGYVAFATAISLIKNQQLLLDKYGLILHTFESRCFDHWNDDLIKMSIIAETIWTVCGSKLDNVRQIATMINNKSHFAYVVSILLLSATMNSLTMAEDYAHTAVDFHMKDLPELLQIFNQLNSIDDLANRLNKIHQFLAIYSLYESLVRHQNSTYDVSDALKPFFSAKKADFLELQQLLKNLVVELNVLIRKNPQPDYIALTEIIEFVNLPQLDQMINWT